MRLLALGALTTRGQLCSLPITTTSIPGPASLLQASAVPLCPWELPAGPSRALLSACHTPGRSLACLALRLGMETGSSAMGAGAGGSWEAELVGGGRG